jgi:hypothetical protein
MSCTRFAVGRIFDVVIAPLLRVAKNVKRDIDFGHTLVVTLGIRTVGMVATSQAVACGLQFGPRLAAIAIEHSV